MMRLTARRGRVPSGKTTQLAVGRAAPRNKGQIRDAGEALIGD